MANALTDEVLPQLFCAEIHPIAHRISQRC